MNAPLQNGDVEWYHLMISQIRKYKDLADAHWDAHKEDADPMDSTALQIGNSDEADFWLKHLLLASQTAPTLHPTTVYRERNSLIKIEMYRKLGLWLCSYFLGVPHPSFWEEIKELAFQLDAYPGGAFYDKMAGDIYRFQRRQRLKAFRRRETMIDSEVSFNGILVMAYTPLLVLPDEHDLTHSVQTLVFSCAEEETFTSEVEKLACRFLRLHSWRYCNDGHGHPIKYLVSYDSVFEAINHIAQLNVAHRKGDKDQEGAALRDLLAFSDLRIRKCFKPDKPDQTLIIAGPDAVRRRGLTSCVIGSNDGVIANRPNRSQAPTAYCQWAEGEVLNVERQKLLAVIKLAEETEDCFRFDATQSSGFSDQWYNKRTPFVQKTELMPVQIQTSLDLLRRVGMFNDDEISRILSRLPDTMKHGVVLSQSLNVPSVASNVPSDVGELEKSAE